MYIDCKNYREDLGVCSLDWGRKCHEDCTGFESISPQEVIPDQTVGIKYDGGKPRLAEMMMDFAPEIIELCKVWEFGADKYNKSNWKSVDDGENRYLNALFRHSIAAVENEYDDESKLLHCAHMIFNCMAYTHFVLKRLNYDKTICETCGKEFNSLSEAIEYRDNFLKEVSRDE